jgi:DNA-directed RNA polymerase delta subunit
MLYRKLIHEILSRQNKGRPREYWKVQAYHENIQDCYNATCLKCHKDELDSKTTMYTDDQSTNANNEAEGEPEYDLDMGLLDEAQDHGDDHLMFTEESGNTYSLS